MTVTLTLLLLSLLGGASAHDKRDLSQLEYVVSVLEQQGRLAEVEEDGRRAVLLSWLETQDGKYPVIPEFKPEYSWYNLSSRLTLDSLTGCLTLIDFFTYCCINCLHILPDLARLEQKYKVEPGGSSGESQLVVFRAS